MKKAFDLSAAFIGLIFATPVIAILAILIRRESEGAAIFAQDRVGLDGRPFRCYKLRTMTLNAPNVPTHHASGAHITKLGAILRRSKLDELPQLWNIVRGEMSFVGPRPCLPTQLELIDERRQRGVLTLLPGITGLAQVNDIDMSDAVRLAEKDAEYLADRSFLGDLYLIYRTVFQRAGSGDRVRQS
ncbi:O-antigen biosynthesis protein WbqP [Pseudorhizobium tarimense]|uniref:O-antigen biosynthesis protein WbqP n=1 Tax=Pseudorhizobium tarimense TaxID=1079109 RepID=A0ABV2H617_9HYPH|nr:sugar transferase [Pseudorhizobium tarimense]MCJ8519285.1 sugar transferase [Pseudorhizobium tarimense]